MNLRCLVCGYRSRLPATASYLVRAPKGEPRIDRKIWKVLEAAHTIIELCVSDMTYLGTPVRELWAYYTQLAPPVALL